jgi:hypothetical protein
MTFGSQRKIDNSLNLKVKINIVNAFEKDPDETYRAYQ